MFFRGWRSDFQLWVFAGKSIKNHQNFVLSHHVCGWYTRITRKNHFRSIWRYLELWIMCLSIVLRCQSILSVKKSAIQTVYLTIFDNTYARSIGRKTCWEPSITRIYRADFFSIESISRKCQNSPQYRFWGSRYLPGILCPWFHHEKTSKNHSEHDFFSFPLVLKFIRVTSGLSQFWPLYDTLNSPVITKCWPKPW